MKPENPMMRLKPNLIIVIGALVALAFIGRDLYGSIIDAMSALTSAETPVASLEAMNTLLLHLLGATLLVPIVTTLGGMGIKLLDEKPEHQRTVPAETHERLVDKIEAADRAAVDRVVNHANKGGSHEADH